jgi:hypothetical protein
MSNGNEHNSLSLGISANADSYLGAPPPAALAMVSRKIGSPLSGDGPASYSCQAHCSNCGMCADCSCNCGTCQCWVLPLSAEQESNGLVASAVPFGDALQILQSI